MNQEISIVGIGYVGLCTAIGFSKKKCIVIAVDKNPKVVELINKGVPPFYEPDLEQLLNEARRQGHLRGVLDIEEAILRTQVTFITVGTPSNSDGSIDLAQIESSSKEIGEALNKKDTYHLIVVKSTVVPGTAENVVIPILERYSHKTCGPDFGLCVNPEFLREGSAVHDTQHPDRIVIGEYDKKSGNILQNLFQELYETSIPIIKTNLPTAEIIKYANNAFLATKISYINMIANICERITGVDVTAVAYGIGLDQRISPLFLRAGIGYGGSCFPKDVKAIIKFSNRLGYSPILLEATDEVNERQALHVVERARGIIKELKGKKVAILGLAFKPGTNDMREARSIPIINQLLFEGATVTAYDPVAISTAKNLFGAKINYAISAIDCLKEADCCIIATEWKEFKQLKPEDFIQHMKYPILIDGRRIYNPSEFREKVEFNAIGLGPCLRDPDDLSACQIHT